MRNMRCKGLRRRLVRRDEHRGATYLYPPTKARRSCPPRPELVPARGSKTIDLNHSSQGTFLQRIVRNTQRKRPPMGAI